MSIFREEVVITAVKVVRYGSKRYVTCGSCGSFLEYEKEDARTVQTGMNEYEKEVVCLNCHETVRVKGQVIRFIFQLWVK